MPSQLANPELQAKPQVAAAQYDCAFGNSLQKVPQAPQFLSLELRFTSQPSVAKPLQSA
jgi:hypothetical protein